MKSAYTNNRWIRGAEDYIARGEDEIAKEIRKSKAAETMYQLPKQLKKEFKNLASLAA